MTDNDHTAADGSLGQCWNQLHAELRRWLAWRIRPPLDVDEIASEVVFRGLHGRNLHLLPRPKLWGWATTTARNYTTDLLRRHRLQPCMLTGDADRWGRPDPDALPACSSLARELVAELRGLAEIRELAERSEAYSELDRDIHPPCRRGLCRQRMSLSAAAGGVRESGNKQEGGY